MSSVYQNLVALLNVDLHGGATVDSAKCPSMTTSALSEKDSRAAKPSCSSCALRSGEHRSQSQKFASPRVTKRRLTDLTRQTFVRKQNAGQETSDVGNIAQPNAVPSLTTKTEARCSYETIEKLSKPARRYVSPPEKDPPANYTFRPTINPNSRRFMDEGQQTMGAFARLASAGEKRNATIALNALHKMSGSGVEPVPSFKPEIFTRGNAFTKRVERNRVVVFEALYKQAVGQKEHQTVHRRCDEAERLTFKPTIFTQKYDRDLSVQSIIRALSNVE